MNCQEVTDPISKGQLHCPEQGRLWDSSRTYTAAGQQRDRLEGWGAALCPHDPLEEDTLGHCHPKRQRL